MEWIKVKEILPKKPGLVIATFWVTSITKKSKRKIVHPLFFYEGKFSHGDQKFKPTHWMPLPGIPKQG